MRSNSNQLGITLLELLVAIAILGILAAIGIPMLTGNIRTAKNIDAQNTLKSIYLMEKNYFAENYCYYVNSASGDHTSTINQYLMGSSTPSTGPISVGSSNDFYFYVLPGTVGFGGSCTGTQSNDYVVYAVSRSMPSLVYSVNQQNIKSGF